MRRVSSLHRLNNRRRSRLGNSRFTNYLRKHRDWLLVIGTVMVLITFFLKEKYREDAKDELLAVTATQRKFQERFDQSTLMSILRPMDDPELKGREYEGQPWYETDRVPLMQMLYQIRERLDYDWVTPMDALKEVEQDLPESKTRTAIREKVIKEIEEVNALGAKAYMLMGTVYTTRKGGYGTPEDFEASNAFTTAENGLWGDFNVYESEVLTDLQSESDHRRKTLGLYSRLTYVFFFIGTIIGAIGKLLDPHDNDEAIEAGEWSGFYPVGSDHLTIEKAHPQQPPSSPPVS